MDFECLECGEFWAVHEADDAGGKCPHCGCTIFKLILEKEEDDD